MVRFTPGALRQQYCGITLSYFNILVYMGQAVGFAVWVNHKQLQAAHLDGEEEQG